MELLMLEGFLILHAFGIREHDSALDLLDPPTDEDYYYDSN
jgi:hypothetical protein